MYMKEECLSQLNFTLSMLRLLSFKSQKRKNLWKPSKPCHVGVHWKALAEYSQMSTHLPGFAKFFLNHFVLAKLATSSIRVKTLHWAFYEFMCSPSFCHSYYCSMWESQVRLLTLMLLVANSTNTKWCKNPEKSLKPWQMGTHLRVLSESFQMNTNMTGFRRFSKIFAFLCIGRM